MKNIKNLGFTLVELIVVVTILAILGTIAFITIGGYARDARNSTRMSDISSIEFVIELYQTTHGSYPKPDNGTEISYSGSSLWTQGSFGTGALRAVERLSTKPVDPILKQEFDYSLTSRGNKYQLGVYMESIAQSNSIIESTYALDNDGLEAYVTGTYSSFDLNASSGSDCVLVTAPSIFISNPPLGGVLTNGGIYPYSYNLSKNMPPYLAQYMTISSGGVNFQINEVYSKCSVDTLSDLNLYVAQLSTAYQQLSTVSNFDKVVYTATSDTFKLSVIDELIRNGITISDSLLSELRAPIADNIFTDIFTGVNGELLVGGHTPVTGTGAWNLDSGNISAYEIQNNALRKSDSSASIVLTVPSPAITSSGSMVSFEVNDFAGGDISSYLRYTDSNNFYALDIESGGYKIRRMLLGTEDIFSNIVDPIAPGSAISFSAYENTLIFSVNGIEKETIIASGIDDIGKPAIYMSNNGASIDNFTLRYK